MAESIEFSKKVVEAVESKTEWYNSTIIPQISENYRLFHTCVKNLYDLLIKKSLIKPDPYKLDRKISGIKPLDNTQFIDGERTTIIGMRFSEFETMLDWICTYYKFSIDSLKIPEIKKLLDYNNSFIWSSLTPNSTMPNTRGLGQLVMEMKRGGDMLTSSSVNDIVSKIQKTTNEIVRIFKDLTEFQKENYKYKIRKEIILGGKFDQDKAFSSEAEEVAQIKKAFTSAIGKEPFYTQLVEEIAREDQASNRDQLQAAVLEKLAIKEEKKKSNAVQIDTKGMLLDAVHSLCAQSTPLGAVYTKLSENNEVLQSASTSFWGQFIAALKKAFGIKDKPIEYEVTIVEPATNNKRKQRVSFTPFSADVQKKASFYNSFALKNSIAYKKFQNADEQKLLEFLNKQIADLQKISIILKALDDYFKNNTPVEKRSKIKGLSMELMALKNNMVNTNQRRAEYISYIEEQEQMKKLGLDN
ncbi:MAG: hypothetical protein VZQ47_12900 [Treponema sp.]|nr:hypothetical protein [Treponema sp.]